MRIRPWHLLVTAALALGCGDKSDDDDDDDDTADDTDDTDDTADDPSGDTATEACEGTAPMVLALACQNGGLVEHPETGEPTPTLSVTMLVADVDGDLGTYTVDLTADLLIDESVGSDAVEVGPVSATVAADPCDTNEAEINIIVFVPLAALPYDTMMEWSAVVHDRAGLESERAFTACSTPNEYGE
jgi:hypothetical protein